MAGGGMNDNIIDARARFQALQDRSGHVVLQSVSSPNNSAEIMPPNDRRIAAELPAELRSQMMRDWLGTRPPVPLAPTPPVADEDDGA